MVWRFQLTYTKANLAALRVKKDIAEVSHKKIVQGLEGIRWGRRNFTKRHLRSSGYNFDSVPPARQANYAMVNN